MYMKQRIQKIIFPNICISFTLAMLLLSAGHIVGSIKEYIQHGGNFTTNGYCLFACELFFLLCLITTACVALEKLHFKNKKTYLIMELIINYVAFWGGAYVFRWTLFNAEAIKQIAVITIIVTAFYLNIYFRTQKMCKKEAEEINRLLKKREKECRKERI